MGKGGKITLLGKQTAQSIAGILQAGFLATDGKPHFGRLPPHSKLGQQLMEIRVGSIIENDKTYIYPQLAKRILDVNRAGMAADPIRGLEYHHLMLTTQNPGGGQATYP